MTRKQSLTSQMIDGVFPSSVVKMPSFKEMPLKTCLQCSALWPNAKKICYHCGFQFYPRNGK